jgi:hypothetical protein
MRGKADTVSEVFDEPVPYGACRAAGLADVFEIPDDMPVQDAFANGCAIALTATLDPSMSLGLESDMELSWIVCSRQFSELEWSPGDYRVTIDGVCYLGYGPDAGVTGCQDKTGAYITTTTFAYTASNNLDSFLDFAATGPEVLRLTRDPVIAGNVAQNWCSSGVGYGTGDFAQWLIDLSDDGAGRYGYTEAEYDDVAGFLWLLGKRVIDLLCPEVADQFRSDVEAVRSGEWPYNSGIELRGLGSVFASWYGSPYERYIETYGAAPDEHWTDAGQAICSELDQGVDPEDRFLSLEAWLDAGAAPTDSLIDAADALHDAAIEGMCPRHSRYYWSIAESGVPWWEIPSN